jgi:phosphoenolpyruvate carboxykinase (ATP)
MKLEHTRAIIDAIHSGALLDMPFTTDDRFGLHIPTECPGVPPKILVPRRTWDDASAYDQTARELADRFVQNFAEYHGDVTREMLEAGPTLQTA